MTDQINSKPELILLPGFLCDADLWRDQITGLTDVAYCRVADLTQGESIPELAATILAEARPTFALAGFSFGGYVAQEIARQAPQRIERFALLDTSLRADTPERIEMRRVLGESARLPGEFQGISDRMLPKFIDATRLSDIELVDRIKSMTLRLGRDVFIRQNAMLKTDGEAVVRSLACPALILCGENDTLTPVSEHRNIAAMMSNSRLAVIEGSGHMAPMEKPEAVTQALREWLSW